MSAMRHILDRPDILHSALLIGSSVRDDTQVLDRVVGQAQPVLELKVFYPASGSFDHFVE